MREIEFLRETSVLDVQSKNDSREHALKMFDEIAAYGHTTSHLNDPYKLSSSR